MLRPSQNVLVLTFGHIIQKAIAAGYFIFIARWVGAEGAGVFAFALSLMLVFGVLVDLGLNYLIPREVAREPHLSREFLSRAITLKLCGAVLAYLLLAVFLWTGNFSVESRAMGLIIGLAMIFDAFMVLFYAVLRGWQDFRYEALGIAISEIVIAVSGTIGLLAGGSILILGWSFVLGSAFNFIYAACRIKQKFGFWPWPAGFSPLVVSMFLAATPFFVSAIFTRLYGYLDTILLTMISGEAAAGFYAAAAKIPNSLAFLPGAFAAGLYPRLSVLAETQRELFGKFFERAAVAFAAIALPIGFGLAFLSEQIIFLLYGAPFERSVAPLTISSIAFMFFFFGFLCSTALNSCDRQKRSMIHLGAAVAISVVVNLLLIPTQKEMGASWAALATAMTVVILGLIALAREPSIEWKKIGVRFFKIIFATATMSVIIIKLSSAVNLFVVIASGGLVYLAALWLLRVVTPEDITTFKNFFRTSS